MSSVPDRIWAYERDGRGLPRGWYDQGDTQRAPVFAVEYIRKDALPVEEAKAMLANSTDIRQYALYDMLQRFITALEGE